MQSIVEHRRGRLEEQQIAERLKENALYRLATAQDEESAATARGQWARHATNSRRHASRPERRHSSSGRLGASRYPSLDEVLEQGARENAGYPKMSAAQFVGRGMAAEDLTDEERTEGEAMVRELMRRRNARQQQ